jgi:hypothetical protein
VSRADVERRLREIERKFDADPDVIFGKTLEQRLANLERIVGLTKSAAGDGVAKRHTPEQLEILRLAGYLEQPLGKVIRRRPMSALELANRRSHNAACQLEKALVSTDEVSARVDGGLARLAADVERLKRQEKGAHG